MGPQESVQGRTSRIKDAAHPALSPCVEDHFLLYQALYGLKEIVIQPQVVVQLIDSMDLSHRLDERTREVLG